MSRPIIRRLKPEEDEVLRKREELAALRATLAERELGLFAFRSQLAAFQGRYLRQVARAGMDAGRGDRMGTPFVHGGAGGVSPSNERLSSMLRLLSMAAFW